MRFGWCVFPLLVVLSLARGASADSAALDPAAEARRTALFEEGRTLHLAGKHAEAVVKLREVVELRKSPQALRALGLAEQDAGKLLDAREHFESALKMAKDGGPTSEIEPAKKALSDLAPRVPRIRIKLPEGGGEVALRVDGAATTLKDGAVEVDPGAHTIAAETAGKPAFAQNVQVDAGRTVDVAVQFRSPPSTTSLRKPIAIAIGSVGAAGLVLGAVTGGLALATHDELAKVCVRGSCPDAQTSKIDTYHALGLTATIGLAAGGALAATGVVLFLTAPSAAKTAGVRVTPFVSAGFAGVRGTF